jgi:hypothetical protein
MDSESECVHANVKTSYGEALIKKEVPSLKTDTIFRSSQFENKEFLLELD